VQRYLELKARYPKEHRFDERTLFGIAATLQGEGKDRESIPFFELAIKEFPGSPFAGTLHDAASRAHVAVGNKTAAIQHLKKLLELDPKDEDAAKRIEELEGK
jgi:tetratricopeptide (TPR) repeat protein